MISWKRQNYRDNNNISSCSREEVVNRQSTEDFGNSENTLYVVIIMNTFHFSFYPIECTIPRMNPKVNYGLWMIICQCRKFISCNTCMTLVEDFDNRGCYACVRAGSIWETSILSSEFCCKPKTALNFFLKIWKK